MSHKQLSIVLGTTFVLLLVIIGITAVQNRSIFPNVPPNTTPTACSRDAKICPDGSTVGRIGPECEFAPCPTASPTKPIEPTQSLNGDTQPANNCVVAGCSGELCMNAADARESGYSPCVVRDYYQCFDLTECERQENGECGWTENEEFNSCMNRYQ